MHRLQAVREQVRCYRAAAQARQRRMLNTAIVAGAVATALTAGPALGGKPLSDRLTAGLGLPAPIWQILCAMTAISALVATIATQLSKAHNLEEQLARAGTAHARLEILELAVLVGRVTAEQALAEFASCRELVSFLPPITDDESGHS